MDIARNLHRRSCISSIKGNLQLFVERRIIQKWVLIPSRNKKKSENIKAQLQGMPRGARCLL